jgi:hypothetical protein
MRGLDPRIHLEKNLVGWIAGSSPAMTDVVNARAIIPLLRRSDG